MRHYDPVGDWRIEGLVAGVCDLGWIGNSGKNRLVCLDWIELALFRERQFFADRSRKLALLRVVG